MMALDLSKVEREDDEPSRKQYKTTSKKPQTKKMSKGFRSPSKDDELKNKKTLKEKKGKKFDPNEDIMIRQIGESLI